MDIHIETHFPIEFDTIYYTVRKKITMVYNTCICCDNIGYITIKNEIYTCPKCFGKSEYRKCIGETISYYVSKIKLKKCGIETFNGSPTEYMVFSSTDDIGIWRKKIELRGDEIPKAKIYENYNEALAESERLNAEEQDTVYF